MTRDEEQADLIRRARKMYREAQQDIADWGSFNDNRLDCPPFDLGTFYAARAEALAILKQFGVTP